MKGKLGIIISIFSIINWDIFYYFVVRKYNFSAGIIFLVLILFGFVPALLKNNFFNFLSFKPQVFWLLWTMYAIIIIYKSKYSNDENTSLAYIAFLICPIIILFLVHSFRNNYVKLLDVLIFSYFFHTLIPLIFDTVNQDHGGSRLGTIFNANLIAIGAFFGVVFILIKRISLTLKKREIFYLATFLIALFLTGSRKASIVLIFFVIGYLFIFFQKVNILKKTKYIFIATPVLIISFFLLSKSEVYNRLTKTLDTTMQAEEDYEMFDGRAIQYQKGYVKFLENPYFGIGLNNYKQFDQYDLVLHSEYLVQLIENGVIGFILFFLFYYHIHKDIKKMKTNKFSSIHKKVFYLILFSIYILYFGSWSFNVYLYWFPIAFILIFSKFSFKKPVS